MNKWIIIVAVFFGCGICASAKDEIQRYDESNRPVFAKKGTWSVGGTAGFSYHSNVNYSFFIIEGINSNGYKVSVAPEFCWFFKDNVAFGARIGYSQNMLDAESVEVKVSSFSIGVDNYARARQNLDAMAFARFFIPIGEAERIAFYTDVGLQGVFGRAKESEQHTGDIVGTYQDSFKAGIFANPGIMAYVFGNRMAIFASLGIAGVGINHVNQIHNQVSDGSRNSFSFNFCINPTALCLGLEFYIGKKK